MRQGRTPTCPQASGKAVDEIEDHEPDCICSGCERERDICWKHLLRRPNTTAEQQLRPTSESRERGRCRGGPVVRAWPRGDARLGIRIGCGKARPVAAVPLSVGGRTTGGQPSVTPEAGHHRPRDRGAQVQTRPPTMRQWPTSSRRSPTSRFWTWPITSRAFADC